MISLMIFTPHAILFGR